MTRHNVWAYVEHGSEVLGVLDEMQSDSQQKVFGARLSEPPPLDALNRRAAWSGRLLASVAWVFAIVLAIPASAQDFALYAELKGLALDASHALEEAPAAEADDLRAQAIEATEAAIAWLDDFFVTATYVNLPAEGRAAASQDRYRFEYNLSQWLIETDRCEEARNRIRALLDSEIDDSLLRPQLMDAYDRSNACLTRSRVGTVRITVTPESADLLVDGSYVGLASTPRDVSVGSHALLLRAPNYESQELVVEVTEEGQVIDIGPIVLVPVPVAVEKTPAWYEWSLWSAGVVGIGVGAAYFIIGTNRQSDLDELQGNFAIIADPEGETETNDGLKLIGIIVGGVGIVSAISGTLSYVLRDAEPVQPEQTEVSFRPTTLGEGYEVWLRVSF